MNRKAATLAGLLWLGLAGAGQAHHSGAMFDRAKTVTLQGTIKEYQYENPHSWLIVNVPGQDGREVVWSLETDAPSNVKRFGLTPSNLKAGDKVTVRAHPLRDGRPGGSFVDVTLPDGRVLGLPSTALPASNPEAH